MIKEIICFSYGDSNDISTWSNVPYLFTKTMESKGIIVHRVNINVYANWWVGQIWNRILKPIINHIWPDNMYWYQRTPIAVYQANKIIRKAVSKYSKSDYAIFMTYDFYNKFNNIPSILYCDVTFEMEKIGRRKQKPMFLEKALIRAQHEAITHSQLVVPLFKKPAEELRSMGYTNIHCCDHYVINKIYDAPLNPQVIIARKKQSNMILFIGNKKTYFRGALMLVEAFRKLKSTNLDLELHIVAMVADDFDNLPDGVFCHGYLHKDIEEECKLYYDLLLEARIICNPTPKWAGISSIMEAMYFYTPFIIAPFDDFKEYIGETLDCGYFNEEFESSTLANNIQRMLNAKDYEQMALNGHEHVKDYTWDNFIDWFISEAENNL